MSSNVQRAHRLEARFLGGLEDAQDAYEEIVATEAWVDLGYDTFAEWWEDRVKPAMRALSMRPTREIAASVVERVRGEEKALPPAQRRTQRELAEMVGVSQGSPAIRPRSTPERSVSTTDLEWQGNQIVEVSPEARDRNAREREERQFMELHSRELAKCVWLLAERARRVDAVEHEISRWQPSQDIYPEPTTAKRLRTAGEFLVALSERWPE